MNRMRKTSSLMLLCTVLLAACASYAVKNAPRIMKEEIDLSDPSLVFLDARSSSDWNKSDSKIRGAIRVDSHDVESWAANFSKDSTIVVYCA